jgi:hypothetical protein
MSVNKLVLVAMFVVAPLVESATIVPDNAIIDDSVQWTPSGSPYVLRGSVSIENNGYLHIMAGVVVRT